MSTALASPKRRPWLLNVPSVYYRTDPWFYFKYDLVWLGLFATSIIAMQMAGWQGLGLEWNLWLVPIFLVACYIQIMAGVFIHNCSHVNFPRPINRLVGEICGMIVGTRFASWEILHRQHHKHSDDTELDPHPIINGFWRFFVKIMLLNLEKNLHLQYFELWGDTPENRRRESFRSLFSFIVGVGLMVWWFFLLGPIGFFVIFFPALVVGAIHVSHFNWATHDAQNPDGKFGPVNLDKGFFWLGNRLWFGLYYHKNHHDYAGLFNPMHYDKLKAERAAKKKARQGNAVAEESTAS